MAICSPDEDLPLHQKRPNHYALLESLDGTISEPLDATQVVVNPPVTPKNQTLYPSKKTEFLERFVMDSRSPVKTYWETINWCVLLVVAIWTPFEAAFGDTQINGERNPKASFVAHSLDAIFDTCFLVDMVLHFFTAYPDEKRHGLMVRTPSKIAWRYLTSWFVVDFITILPGILDIKQLIAPLESAEDDTHHLHMMRVVRLVRLMRLASFFDITRKWQISSGASYSIISLGNFLMLFVLACHWIACLWGGIAMAAPPGVRTWIVAVREAKGGPDSLYEEYRGVYAMSLYWAIMTITSIGYGDIIPQSEAEYWTSACCMAIMAGLWAYIIGQVCGVVSTLMPHDVEFKRTMDDLNWLMQDRGVPLDERKELRRYFHESRDIKRLTDQRAIIDQLSPMLQGQVSMQLLSAWQTKVSYISSMDQDVLVRLVRKLRPMLYAPQEAIVGDRTLFICRRGMCLSGAKVCTTGDVWGKDMVVANHKLRKISVTRCLSYMEALSLRYADLMFVVEPFPREQERIRWARTRFACFRGAQIIASAVRVLKKTTGQHLFDLSEAQRQWLYRESIRGSFTGTVPAEDRNARGMGRRLNSTLVGGQTRTSSHNTHQATANESSPASPTPPTLSHVTTSSAAAGGTGLASFLAPLSFSKFRGSSVVIDDQAEEQRVVPTESGRSRRNEPLEDIAEMLQIQTEDMQNMKVALAEIRTALATVQGDTKS